MAISLSNINMDILNYIACTLYANLATGKKDLKTFSTTCRSARAAAMPFLFRSITARQDWSLDSLRELNEMAHIKTYVRIFGFLPRPVRDPNARFKLPRDVLQPRHNVERISQCTALLAELLGSFTCLRRLLVEFSISYGPEIMDNFLSVLGSTGVRLPTVRALAIEANAVPLFVGTVCPLVTDLSVHATCQNAVCEWVAAPNVTRLELAGRGWALQEFEAVNSKAILETMPNIQNLTVENLFRSGNVEHDLATFHGLRNLQVLSLAALDNLRLGYSPQGWCGTGRRFLSEESRDDRRRAHDAALRRVKRVAKGTFPSLKYLWLSNRTLFDFTPLKAHDVEALDSLPSAWNRHTGDKEKLDVVLQAHPECKRFIICGTSRY